MSRILPALDGDIPGSGGMHGTCHLCPAGDADWHKVECGILREMGNPLDVIGPVFLANLHNDFPIPPPLLLHKYFAYKWPTKLSQKP